MTDPAFVPARPWCRIDGSLRPGDFSAQARAHTALLEALEKAFPATPGAP